MISEIGKNSKTAILTIEKNRKKRYLKECDGTTIDKAFSEVYEIIMNLEPELYNKIPKHFVENIKRKKDNNYECCIDYSKDLNAQPLLKETRVLLSLIYRDYLCDKAEKMFLLNKEELALKNIYSYDNLFKNRKKSNQPETYLIEVRKEKWYKKLFNFFRNILKK